MADYEKQKWGGAFWRQGLRETGRVGDGKTLRKTKRAKEWKHKYRDGVKTVTD